VRFRYKLEGRDAAWQSQEHGGKLSIVTFVPGVPFRVIASNNDGVWNEEGETLDFSVAPACIRRTGSNSLGGVRCLHVWVIYRLAVLQISRAIGARFDERLAERTRMARDLHDTFLQTIQGSKLVCR